MKEIYEWSQTPKTITIKLPTSYKIDSKNFHSEITEFYIQFNIIDLKKHGIIYFHDKVNFESSRVKIFDRHIEFFIEKIEEANWPDLEPKISKEELADRRKIAKENYSIKIEENRKKATEKKKELEKFVIDKSMKLDADKRNELKEKKNQEKSNVENDLYDFVKEYDEKEKHLITESKNSNLKKYTLNNEKDAMENENNKDGYSNTYKQSKFLALAEDEIKLDNKLVAKDALKLSNINEMKKDIFEEEDFQKQVQKKDLINEKADKIINNENVNKKNFSDLKSTEIFDEKTLEKEKSQIRNQSKIDVNLTEKAIPHFAARESLSKEPPYPKSKKFIPEKNHVK